ncbi:MAG: S41 family peptidase [Hyphomicrobiales bacterium]|nr:S41 family peptidase [Hyphomicrobiales bacterium]
MIRRITLLLMGALLGASTVLLILNASTYNSIANAAGADTYRQLSIFGDIFERVRSQYVKEPKEQDLVENAINGMLSSLDPHSSYLTAKDFDSMRVQTRGEFGGLGIEVTMEKELIKVVTPIDDTPASKAGVLAGDLISKIDGENVRGLSLSNAVEKMRGPVNTPIVITVLREGAEKPIDITIIRAIIKVRAVHHRIEGGDIGYIRISSFSEQTFDGLNKAVKKIRKKVGDDKLKGFILDLRLNPGGLLDQAISVSDTFLDRGEIVSTRGRNADETRRYSARPGDSTGGKPVIVLVNGGSASASEIVAGALQDHKRATILGTRSFGKGSVQTIIPLGSNGALRLTTALYYTPSGTSIQGKGIQPDIKVNQPVPDELKGRIEARGESKLRGHITGAEEDKDGSGSIAYVPPETKDDLQLGYAMDLLRGAKEHAAFPPNPNATEPKKDG